MDKLNAKTRWFLYPEKKELSQKIAAALEISPVLAQILLNRNIKSLDAAKQFLYPHEFTHTHNFKQSDLDAASKILFETIQNKGKIFLYGDYDVDGITSTSLMIHVIRHLEGRYDYHVPHRITEGYGLNKSVLERVAKSNTTLLITMDCGISNYDELTQLKQLRPDIKIIILDHHRPPETLPPVDVILNPRDLDATHPFKDLCAAGVTYHFLKHFIAYHKIEMDMTRLIDLAALGTIADIVPLTNENRALAKAGLGKMSRRPNMGIQSILEVAEFKKRRVNAIDVGFVIGPRFNAPGRISHAKIGIELLTSQKRDDADKIARELEALNIKRRKMGEIIFKQAESEWDSSPKSQKVVVMSHVEWHAGIIGITASQLVNKYQCPSVLIAYDDTIGRGSARSVQGVDIYEILKQCSEHFETFGGHRGAAGFSILPKNIPAFEKKLIEVAEVTITEKDLETMIHIDAKLAPEEMGMDLCGELGILSPFGEGNVAPIFYSNELLPVEFKTVGNGKHLKVTFSDKYSKKFIDGIGFGLGDKLPILYQNQIEVIFHLETNDWTGIEVPQLNLIDIK